jgi:hypothetical protein
MYLEFVFLCSLNFRSKFILYTTWIALSPELFVEKVFISLPIYSNSILDEVFKKMWLHFWTFSSSTYLFVNPCSNYTFFIMIYDRIFGCHPPTLLFSFKIILDTFGPWKFHKHFRIKISNFSKTKMNINDLLNIEITCFGSRDQFREI